MYAGTDGGEHKTTILLLSIVVNYAGMVLSTGVTERNATTAVIVGITRVWNMCCRSKVLLPGGHWQRKDEFHQVRLVLVEGDQVNLDRLLRCDS